MRLCISNFRWLEKQSSEYNPCNNHNLQGKAFLFGTYICSNESHVGCVFFFLHSSFKGMFSFRFSVWPIPLAKQAGL